MTNQVKFARDLKLILYLGYSSTITVMQLSRPTYTQTKKWKHSDAQQRLRKSDEAMETKTSLIFITLVQE